MKRRYFVIERNVGSPTVRWKSPHSWDTFARSRCRRRLNQGPEGISGSLLLVETSSSQRPRRWFVVEQPLGRNRWRRIVQFKVRLHAEVWVRRRGSPGWRVRKVEEWGRGGR